MMSSRHLPAGQGIQGDTGRRRSYNQHQYQHQQYLQQPIYSTFMPAYSPTYYSQSMPPHYQNSQVPVTYLQQQSFIGSPPLQQYVSSLHQQQQVSYSCSSSPAAPLFHQTHLPHSQTPVSSQSSYSSNTFLNSLISNTSKKASSEPIINPSAESLVTSFKPPLPWYSRPDLAWPKKRNRIKSRPGPQISSEAVKIPIITPKYGSKDLSIMTTNGTTTKLSESFCQNYQLSDQNSTSPLTQTTIPSHSAPSSTASVNKVVQRVNNITVPIIPALPKYISRQSSISTVEKAKERQTSDLIEIPEQTVLKDINKLQEVSQENIKESESAPQTKAWVTPKLWAGIFRPAVTSSNVSNDDTQKKNVSTCKIKNETSLAEVLKSFNTNSTQSKAVLLEPRGLVNAGNMCYMNSILQVLIFCTLFFNFLDKVSNDVVYSFKSSTPLLDAMILFMQEYSVINSTPSADQLQMRLKEGDLEQYGEPFMPEFFYNVINRLPRFSSMRRGHQQDAEEFLGFLLEGLHDECAQVIENTSTNLSISPVSSTSNFSSPSTKTDNTQPTSISNETAWLEVGPKQKATVTRSSGFITIETPITKIFGGNLRSELRVPGLKDSVTMEPYQSLLLDIGAPHVSNIIDALKGLTRSELLHGDFKSPKGPNITATKQVFIETVPPVLILHLKRFQYENTGGTQKIWKKIGYPLELELPKEVFPRQKRIAYGRTGFPRYRLISAVYHHGKNASVGHYTVDVRRQDGREWIRLDDTTIRRVRSEEVAEGGSEEDPKVFVTTNESKVQQESGICQNSLTIHLSEKSMDKNGWKQANSSGKKWLSTVNGNSNPESKGEIFSVKDNKVAYLLFYQKI